MAVPEQTTGETRDPAEVAADLAKREAWAEAVPQWCAALTKRPGDRGATIGLSEALAHLGAPGPAAVMLRDILAKHPDDTKLALRVTQLAEQGRDWPLAIQIRRQLHADAPNDVEAAAAFGRVLRDGGQLQDSVTMLAAANARFPDNYSILRQRALSAMIGENWPLARDCWATMVRINPQDDNAVNRVKMCSERAAAMVKVAAPEVPARAAKHRPSAELLTVLNDVVTLGVAPDLAELLRDYGVEPAGPFASAQAGSRGVIEAVRARFVGFGDVAQMRLEAAGAEYRTVDTRYDIRSPSHVATSEVASPDILARAGERQRAARDELLGQMESGAKLFVHAAPQLSDAEIDNLMGALRDIGPVTVLFVRAADPGKIEEIQEGMFVAGIDKFDAVDPSGMWTEFLTVAHRRLAARAALAGFASRRRAA